MEHEPFNENGEDIDLCFNEDRSAKFESLTPPTELVRYTHQPHAPDIDDPEYPSFARGVIESAFYRGSLRIEDTVSERTLLAWRITREMCRHLGLLAGGESLSTALLPTPANLDPWTHPTLPPHYHPEREHSKAILECGVPEVLGDLEAFEQDIPDKSEWLKMGADSRAPGIGPLPPNLPGTSPVFKFWLKQADRIARFLCLSQGSPIQQDLAEVALPQLLTETHRAWPTRGQIVAFEEIVVNHTIEMLSSQSQWSVMREINARFGLMRHEQKMLLETARATLLGITMYDVDEARALMIVRLENFMERSKQAMDLRAELAGMKQMAQIQGLTRTETGDLISDFTNIVHSVSTTQDNRRKELGQ